MGLQKARQDWAAKQQQRAGSRGLPTLDRETPPGAQAALDSQALAYCPSVVL